MELPASQDHTLAIIFSYYAFKIATVIASGVSIYLEVIDYSFWE
jgi:hypothetical protein